jgi:hypothetical protein
MNAERVNPRRPQVPFDVWKLRLVQDFERLGKLDTFDAIPDNILQFFWRRDLEPTVKAIVNHGVKAIKEESLRRDESLREDD